MRAIQMSEFGGPEVLRLVELPDPQPGPEEVLIRVSGRWVLSRDLPDIVAAVERRPPLAALRRFWKLFVSRMWWRQVTMLRDSR